MNTPTPHRVLLVTTDDLLRDSLQAVLARVSMPCKAASAAEVPDIVGTAAAVVLVDHRPPILDAIPFVSNLRVDHPQALAVVLTAAFSREDLGPLIQKCDPFACLRAPWDNEVLALTVRRAAELAACRVQAPATAANDDEALRQSALRVFV